MNEIKRRLTTRRGFTLGRIGIGLNRGAVDNLTYLTGNLGSIIGRPVSRTLAVRLALAELRREVERLKAEGNSVVLQHLGIKIAREVR